MWGATAQSKTTRSTSTMTNPLPPPEGDGVQWRAEWTGRTEPIFVEVAEALAIPTDLIMAAAVHEGRITAMYTRPDDERDLPAVYALHFDRDVFGVLQAIGEPFEVPGMLEEVRRNVEGKLRRDNAYGDPPPRRHRRGGRRKR